MSASARGSASVSTSGALATGAIACIGRMEDAEARTMYPDLLAFHRTESGIRVDIIDPHDPSKGDAGPKWTGLARYAKERGVYLIGHLETGGDVHGFEKRMEAAFEQCRRLGIRAIKTGYVNHGQGIRRYDSSGNLLAKEWQHGQYMVRHYRKAVETAAAYRVVLNVHEPIKDTGIRRT